MATFETASLGLAVMQWVSNLRRSMRTNANLYKARLTAGASVASVAAIANADAAQYLALLAGLDQYISDVDRRTKLLDGLSVFSINQSAASTELTTLRTIAEGQRDANKTTANQINGMANTILANLPAYDLPMRG